MAVENRVIMSFDMDELENKSIIGEIKIISRINMYFY